MLGCMDYILSISMKQGEVTDLWCKEASTLCLIFCKTSQTSLKGLG